jgi:2-dehydropantoate 2-reductase
MIHPSFHSVAVMGAGAVGCYFGAVLADAGMKVRLIGRQTLVDAVARDGLLLETAKFSKRIRLEVTADPAGVRDAGLVLFSVKSPDTETAAAAIAPHIAPDGVVLSLQNGVDNFERLRARIANTVVPAVVYVAAEIPAPGVVRHNGRGDLVIGAPRGSGVSGALIADLAAFLGGAKIPTRVSGNIEGELWTKLILNGAYNAISALGRSNYGRLVAVPDVRHVMREAVAEIVALAHAKGVRLELADPMATVLALAGAMPEQMSSTAQDLARGRPTEIDHLNGYIMRESDALGLPVPVNRTLAALVKLAEGARSG